jgi:hypothetical protein
VAFTDDVPDLLSYLGPVAHDLPVVAAGPRRMRPPLLSSVWANWQLVAEGEREQYRYLAPNLLVSNDSPPRLRQLEPVTPGRTDVREWRCDHARC